MLSINSTPALAAKVPPANDDEAAARATELTIESVDGLIGTVWQGVEQLKKALAETGWKLEAPIYGQTDAATTWIGKAMKRERMIKLVLNSYAFGHLEVCNCWVMGDVIEEQQHPLDAYLEGNK